MQEYVCANYFFKHISYLCVIDFVDECVEIQKKCDEGATDPDVPQQRQVKNSPERVDRHRILTDTGQQRGHAGTLFILINVLVICSTYTVVPLFYNPLF